LKDVFKEAHISVTDKNKKEIDQAGHKLMAVKYKKCIPDCWSEVEKTLADTARCKRFIAALKKAVAA